MNLSLLLFHCIHDPENTLFSCVGRWYSPTSYTTAADGQPPEAGGKRSSPWAVLPNG